MALYRVLRNTYSHCCVLWWPPPTRGNSGCIPLYLKGQCGIANCVDHTSLALYTNGALYAVYVPGGQVHVPVLAVGRVVQVVVLSVGVHH